MMYYIIVFENLRFRLSTRKREAGVFKISPLGRVLTCVIGALKTTFTCARKANTKKKNLRFEKYLDSCGRRLKCLTFFSTLVLKGHPQVQTVQWKDLPK